MEYLKSVFSRVDDVMNMDLNEILLKKQDNFKQNNNS